METSSLIWPKVHGKPLGLHDGRCAQRHAPTKVEDDYAPVEKNAHTTLEGTSDPPLSRIGKRTSRACLQTVSSGRPVQSGVLREIRNGTNLATNRDPRKKGGGGLAVQIYDRSSTKKRKTTGDW